MTRPAVSISASRKQKWSESAEGVVCPEYAPSPTFTGAEGDGEREG